MRLFAPAADRNKAPISETLKKLQPFNKPADVLEIGAGTGQHAAYLSTELSVNSWQPTEYDQGDGLLKTEQSIASYCEDIDMVKPCLPLDASAEKHSAEIEG